MPKPDKLVNNGKTPLENQNYFNWASNTNRLRNLQENKFAYKQDEDNIETDNSLDNFEVGDLEWNG